VAEYGQCGGIGYTGSTECCPPFTCQIQNSYYSGCMPQTSTTSPPSTAQISTIILFKLKETLRFFESLLIGTR